MRRALLAGTLAAALAVPAAASAAPEIDVGTARDGRIEVRLPGGENLVEARHRGTGPGGRLGFLAGGRWYHATKPLRKEGRPIDGVLLTDDPDGRRIELKVRGGGDGTLGISARVTGAGDAPVEAIGIGFLVPGTERMLGFGERSNRVDQRGNTVENYVGEGPYQPSEYGLIRATVPPWGVHEREDASYFPMPWLLSTRGYGVLAKNLETSRFHLTSLRSNQWSFEVESDRMALRVIAGPQPADVVRRLTEITGRQPKPAAPWLFGPWVQTGHGNTAPEELANLGVLREADAPVSAAETHMRYMPCGSDVGQEASEAQRTADLHALGLAALTYTREAICASYPGPYEQAVATDAFLERPDGSPATFQGFVGSGVTQIGMLDFTDPDATPIYRGILDRAYRAGYDGWMEDYGEYTPPDSVADNGMTGARNHNFYPVTYHRAGWRYAKSKKRPIVSFVRSGFTGVHPYAQVVWGGDPTTGWGFDGLASSVREALSMGLSGISTWGSDIGGFFTLSDQRLTPELLARWLEFGAFSGVMRTKAEGIGVPKSARPQVWEPETLPLYRRYAKLRTQLYPYLVAADRAYRRTGMPIMRHLSLVYPEDRRAVRQEDQFMFGPDLMVAPVIEPGATSRDVYVPDGRWVDVWRSVAYREGDGSLRLGRTRGLAGGRAVSMRAPLEEIPLLARAGTMLPLLPADVETLAPYAPGDHVGLADRRDRFDVLAFARGTARAAFLSDGVLRANEIRGGGWRLNVAGSRPRVVRLQVSLADLKRPFVPERVEVDGERLSGWTYDERSRVVRLRARLGEGSIAVLP